MKIIWFISERYIIVTSYPIGEFKLRLIFILWFSCKKLICTAERGIGVKSTIFPTEMWKKRGKAPKL